MLRGQLAVFLPQEKHVRVAAVGAPVELTAKNRVADAMLCGHTLAVEKPHIPHIVPVKPHIAADAAVIHHTERGHNRHAAAQNQLVAAQGAQPYHSALHPRGTGFVFVAKRRCTVQKVQLDKVKAPIIQHAVKDRLQVILHGGVVDIQRVKAAPVAAAAPRLPIHLQQPIRVFTVQGGLFLADKRRQPQACQKAVFVCGIGDGAQPLREFGGVGFQPIAHLRLPAVVDLKEISLPEQRLAALQVLQN